MCLSKILKDLNILDSESSSLIINHNYTIVNFISFMTDLSLISFFYTSSEEADFLFSLKIDAL